MKTSLSHLPPEKQEEVAMIKDVILSHVKAELIILFGSYATGKWVEDRYIEEGTTYEYKSDFDILVITKNRKVELGWGWPKINHKISRELRGTKTVIIHHTIDFVNEKIRDNYYFLVDILREGILLYDSGNYQLAEPKPLTPERRKQKAQEEFEYWSERGNDSLEGFEFYLSKQKYNEAAFNLHQATERYYAAFLLVFTDYKPKTHDIEELGAMASKVYGQMQGVFPRSSQEEKRLFELLRRAYVEARYSKQYVITASELTYLAERVKALQALVEKLCQAEITRLTAAINS